MRERISLLEGIMLSAVQRLSDANLATAAIPPAPPCAVCALRPPSTPPPVPTSPPPPSPAPPSPPSPSPKPSPPPTPPPLDVLNELQECFFSCAQQVGRCEATNFCGTQGACCRKGFDTGIADCGYGTAGCEGNHCCVASVGAGVNARQLQSSLPCVPRESFINLDFDYAETVRSHLGGQGGRCDKGNLAAGGCDEVVSGNPPVGVPQELYIRDVGRNELGYRAFREWQPNSNAQYIDMRITNASEYYAWNTVWNGIKRDPSSGQHGSFAVVNLLGPRDPSQSGRIWNSNMTFVELDVAFLGRSQAWDPNGDINAQLSATTPITLNRTFMAFYDFDTGLARFDNALSSPEAMQLESTHVTGEYLPASTELERLSSWNQVADAAQINSFFSSQTERDALYSWPSLITKGSRYGIGKDNPVSTFTLDELQANRSIKVEFESVSTFRIRYAITECCTTGRNFMFGGFVNSIEPGLCPMPPPSTPPPPSSPPPASPPPPSPPPPSTPPPSSPPPFSPPPTPYSPASCDNLDDRDPLPPASPPSACTCTIPMLGASPPPTFCTPDAPPSTPAVAG